QPNELRAFHGHPQRPVEEVGSDADEWERDDRQADEGLLLTCADHPVGLYRRSQGGAGNPCPKIAGSTRSVSTNKGRAPSTGMSVDSIVIKGAAEHNLKHIDLVLPRNRLIVLTGLLRGSTRSMCLRLCSAAPLMTMESTDMPV